MYDYTPKMLIGVLRRVATLAEDEDMTVPSAMYHLADEIEKGINARENGETDSLTTNELMRGIFIGKPKLNLVKKVSG